jgi:hypothetical protein
MTYDICDGDLDERLNRRGKETLDDFIGEPFTLALDIDHPDDGALVVSAECCWPVAPLTRSPIWDKRYMGRLPNVRARGWVISPPHPRRRNTGA